jgi:hypothetical protein
MVAGRTLTDFGKGVGGFFSDAPSSHPWQPAFGEEAESEDKLFRRHRPILINS